MDAPVETPADTVAELLVVGLGNPILGDDGAGWAAAELLAQTGALPPGVAVENLSLGGLSLMERLVGLRSAVLIDAITTGQAPPGTVRSFPLASLEDRQEGHTRSAHDASLQTALQLGRRAGADLPDSEDITVVSIEIEPCFEFSEQLSPAVAAAVPEAARAALQAIHNHTRHGGSNGIP